MDLFKQALTIDPNCARAWAGDALSHAVLYRTGSDHHREYAEKCRDARHRSRSEVGRSVGRALRRCVDSARLCSGGGCVPAGDRKRSDVVRGALLLRTRVHGGRRLSQSRGSLRARSVASTGRLPGARVRSPGLQGSRPARAGAQRRASPTCRRGTCPRRRSDRRACAVAVRWVTDRRRPARRSARMDAAGPASSSPTSIMCTTTRPAPTRCSATPRGAESRSSAAPTGNSSAARRGWSTTRISRHYVTIRDSRRCSEARKDRGA